MTGRNACRGSGLTDVALGILVSMAIFSGAAASYSQITMNSAAKETYRSALLLKSAVISAARPGAGLSSLPGERVGDTIIVSPTIYGGDLFPGNIPTVTAGIGADEFIRIGLERTLHRRCKQLADRVHALSGQRAATSCNGAGSDQEFVMTFAVGRSGAGGNTAQESIQPPGAPPSNPDGGTPGWGGTPPGNSGNTPPSDGSAPGNSGNTPGDDDDNSGQEGSGGNNPGQGNGCPGNSCGAPGQGGDNPGQGNGSPGGGNNCPGNSCDAPGQGGSGPGNSGNAPGQGGNGSGNGNGNAPGGNNGDGNGGGASGGQESSGGSGGAGGGSGGLEEFDFVLSNVAPASWGQTPGWGSTITSNWIPLAEIGATAGQGFTISGDGSPTAQNASGQRSASGNFGSGGFNLQVNTPSCGSAHHVIIELDDGRVGYWDLPARPEWPSDWGQPPAGC